MLKVLDTFAGAGGFSLGFGLAGCEVIGAIEMDAWAAATFRYNHPGAKVIEQEIEEISDDELYANFAKAKPAVVLGGPPCQGFSVCRKDAGDPKDPRNALFKEFIRVGRVFEPSVMVMENVPNLEKSKTQDGSRVLDIIQTELSYLGYHVYSQVLDAAHYGVPQMRKRLFVIATRKRLNNPFPHPTHSVDEIPMFGELIRTPTLWDAISDLPDLAAGEGSEEMKYTKSPQNEYQGYLRHNSGLVLNHKAMDHSKRMVERFEAMSWGQSTADVPDHLRPYKRNGIGVISEKVYDQNNRRMHPHRLCHTIPASFYANFVHPYAHRNFTAREGARIQSFPDWYKFLGKPTVVSHKLLAREGRFEEKKLCQYNQIGNAVPPLLAKAIAENIVSQL